MTFTTRCCGGIGRRPLQQWRSFSNRICERSRCPEFEMVCERPPRSLRSRLPLTRGRLSLFSPSVRGRAAEGGRGSLTRYLGVGRPFSRTPTLHKSPWEKPSTVRTHHL